MIMMFEGNRICKLFNIQYPIIQGGMVWCSGWKLASAVSNAGGLGLIGAGSMYPQILREHIQKCKSHTSKPFGVNIPLLYPDIEKHMEIIHEEDVKIVFTSAGNPAKWTSWLKERGKVVVHVVPNVALARKCLDRGVDAVVCEGFEAGGHNGRDELTTMVLTPQVVDAVGSFIPVISAGGIGDGRGMLAAMALGADGVQLGSRFAVTVESSAHLNYKKSVIEATDTDTVLTLKKVTPVRLIKNAFYEEVLHAELSGADSESLRELLGKGRAKKGIFEGDVDHGELEVGQISGMIDRVLTVEEVFKELLETYSNRIKSLNS